MAETKSSDEPALPAKRKPDLSAQDPDNLPLKSPKLQTLDEATLPNEGNHAAAGNDVLEPSANNDSPAPEPGVDAEEEEEEDDDYEHDDEDDDDDDNDDEDDEEEEENGNAAVDRKGKGILVEEEKDSDDDEDDSSDGENLSEGETDLSDDPLAEVDLDNILPSRTRRRVPQPGVYIAKDVGNNGQGDDTDDSDS